MRLSVSALALRYEGFVLVFRASSMLRFGCSSRMRSTSSMSGSDAPSFLLKLRTALRWPGLSPSHGWALIRCNVS